MITETIRKLKGRIESADSLQGPQKGELLSLLDSLRSEIDELSKTRAEHAESIAGFVKVSAHEATRSEKDPELLQLSLDALASSVRGFEASHPKLVKAVNTICVTLANQGI